MVVKLKRLIAKPLNFVVFYPENYKPDKTTNYVLNKMFIFIEQG
ncbi:hypothetical protein SAMN05216524_106402 [Mucilaginibacter sp. OK098]|nr:hypothetical protein SAMN05216524_106402 [Mucilaginibacter sp. OK098]